MQDQGLSRRIPELEEEIAKQKALVAELLHANQRFNHLLDSITDAFFSLDHQWCFTFLNPKTELLIQAQNKSPVDMLGKNMWVEFPAIQRLGRQELHRAVAEGVSVHYEDYYQPLRSWFEVHAYPFADGISIYLRDITDRKMAYEALVKSQSRLQILKSISIKATSAVSVEEVISYGLGEMSQAFPRYRIAYSTIDEEGILSFFQSMEPEGMQNMKGRTLDLNIAPRYLAALKRHQLVAVEDITRDGAFEPLQEFTQSIATRAVLDMPVKHSGQLVGLLSMNSPEPHAWSEFEIATITEVSEYLSIAIQDAQSQEDRRRLEQAMRESEHFAHTVISGVREGIVVYDPDLRFLVWNRFMEDMTGIPAERVLGERAIELFPQLYDQGEQLLHRALRGETVRSAEIPYRIPQTGREGWAVSVYSPLTTASGGIVGVVCVVREVTERKLADRALKESEERYALAAQGSNDGLWDWSLEWSEMYFSPRWKSMLGFEENEIGNDPEEWFRRVHPEEIELLREQITAHLEEIMPHFQCEYRILHKDGSYRWMLSRGIAVRNDQGKPYRMAGSQTDITDRKQTEQQLLHDAFHDGLTGLSNRALFMDRLGLAVEHGKRRKEYNFAVLFLDLDRFKVINDSLGHRIGDQLLVSIAQQLEDCLRPGDTVARLGGDEFAVLLDDIVNLDDAVAVAERIQKEISNPFLLDGHEVFTTASIGIALSTTGYDRPEDLLRDADTAMYRAKAQGKARYEVFDRGMHARAVTLLQLETDLRRAEEREEFVLHYQPIICLKSGVIRGFEALVRWRHPTRGLVYPNEFIPMAEETGLIVPISQWILREACLHMGPWQQSVALDHSLGVSVNVSCRQFMQPDLIRQIDRILMETGIDPADLRLEITESVIMENPDAAISLMLQLKERKIQIHIDDFGTGYSSLSYLQRFPIDALKIDRSFVSGIGTSGEKQEMVAAVLTLARSLGKEVIAEGIETPEQLSMLQSLQCQFGQGFYFSKPLDRDSTESLITRWPSSFDAWKVHHEGHELREETHHEVHEGHEEV